jgi:hypothetical protein
VTVPCKNQAIFPKEPVMAQSIPPPTKVLTKESKEALETALRDLEDVRMTRADDPTLTKLKADIRQTIERPESETEDDKGT